MEELWVSYSKETRTTVIESWRIVYEFQFELGLLQMYIKSREGLARSAVSLCGEPLKQNQRRSGSEWLMGYNDHWSMV
jgi:hypothetical protein